MFVKIRVKTKKRNSLQQNKSYRKAGNKQINFIPFFSLRRFDSAGSGTRFFFFPFEKETNLFYMSLSLTKQRKVSIEDKLRKGQRVVLVVIK